MFTDPEKNVLEFGFMPGETVADLGSGSGHYALALARAVGKSGTVIAVDIQGGLLLRLKSMAREAGLENVVILSADLEEPVSTHLDTRSVDGVVISNLLFQVEKKDVVVEEAKRILKLGGRICVIDWTEKFDKEEAKKLFQKKGLTLAREFDAGDHHYGLIFQK